MDGLSEFKTKSEVSKYLFSTLFIIIIYNYIINFFMLNKSMNFSEVIVPIFFFFMFEI